MKMEKQWKKQGKEKFSLYINGQLNISLLFPQKDNVNKALIEFQDRKFTFEKFGLSKTKATLTDTNGQVIMDLKPEKWYSDVTMIEMGNRNYRIKTRNAPLVHYMLFEGENQVLTYGLESKESKPVLKIITHQLDASPLLDALMFILFYPVLLENVNDDLLMLLLLAS